MILKNNIPSIKNRAIIFLPDDGALLAVAEHGIDALDWLFLPGAQVVITDAVRHELLRDRTPGEDDYAPNQRPLLDHWFMDNAFRIAVISNEAGDRPFSKTSPWEWAEHRTDGVSAWDWSDSLRAAGAIRALDALPVSENRRILVIANHDATRAAIRTRTSEYIDLTGTLRFFGLIAAEFQVPKATSLVSRDFADV